jgi:predicted glycosyltransferase
MRIWIDIENTPHAMIFRPIIEALNKRGHDVFVTAKDIGQTLGMLDLFGIRYTAVGGGVRQKRLMKARDIFQRSMGLLRVTRRQRFDIGLNHGSRSHIGACRLRRVRCIISYDYEYGSKFLVHPLVDLTLVPDVFSDDLMRSIGADPARVRKYPGLKEELYLAGFIPSQEFILPVPADCILAVVRPPSSTAHYHNIASEATCLSILDRIAGEEAHIVGWVVPRTPEEGEWLAERYAGAPDKIIIQKKAVDGLELIWRADLVISGGGTMTREAAVMGVPSYSIFASRLGAVDRHLADTGRLHLIRNGNQIDRIKFVKRDRKPFVPPSPRVLEFFLEIIESNHRVAGHEHP